MDVEELETQNISAIVEVGLHESCMRGRDGYYSGVRPNHWMPGRNYCFMGQLDFVDTDLLEPGATCKAIGSFIIASKDIPEFVPGFCWHICEANKIVGYGKVIEITNT
jgi:hypothetical protein